MLETSKEIYTKGSKSWKNTEGKKEKPNSS